MCCFICCIRDFFSLRVSSNSKLPCLTITAPYNPLSCFPSPFARLFYGRRKSSLTRKLARPWTPQWVLMKSAIWRKRSIAWKSGRPNRVVLSLLLYYDYVFGLFCCYRWLFWLHVTCSILTLISCLTSFTDSSRWRENRNAWVSRWKVQFSREAPFRAGPFGWFVCALISHIEYAWYAICGPNILGSMLLLNNYVLYTAHIAFFTDHNCCILNSILRHADIPRLLTTPLWCLVVPARNLPLV